MLPLEPYLTYWRERREKERARSRRLRREAREDASKIAALLRREFGATRVILFGSLVRERFHAGSDIDLAVEGLEKRAYFSALAQANRMSRFRVDIKPLEELNAHFKQRVLSTGEEL